MHNISMPCGLHGPLNSIPEQMRNEEELRNAEMVVDARMILNTKHTTEVRNEILLVSTTDHFIQVTWIDKNMHLY